MKVAIVHDYLNQRGGAERVVAVFHEMFPEAPIFTSIVDQSMLGPELGNADIRPSWMQKLPGWRKHFKKYLPLYPKAIESFDLGEYDLILSSSSAFAKGALKKKEALHICYCYTPMRFVWDFDNYIARENVPKIYRKVLPYFLERMRQWDLETSSRPDHYVAISSDVQKRIKSIYGRDSKVIFPPVETQKFQPLESRGDFYLIVSRLASYKRIDLAIQAFNHLGLPLKIIGLGPYQGELKGMARPHIEFLGRLSDREVARYYGACKALIFPGSEDFGLVPLEANAAGRPVIAFKGGGALDTIVEGVNGLFFTEPSVNSLVGAIQALENKRFYFQSPKIREHALKFDKEVFKDKFRQLFADLDIHQKIV
jgi:glycosyltransferase involved in cell wall biosynthesis